MDQRQRARGHRSVRRRRRGYLQQRHHRQWRHRPHPRRRFLQTFGDTETGNDRGVATHNVTINGVVQADPAIPPGATVYSYHITSGADSITGSKGRDTIAAGSGNDTAYGLSGNDTLYGEDGKDKLYGGSGSDILYGNDGDDRLWGDTGWDTLTGGRGNDAFVFRKGGAPTRLQTSSAGPTPSTCAPSPIWTAFPNSR
ncbi:MAG: hypothetical protein IPL91_16150 [Hyphomicrobium sp.]|nr:hypothetical protein [Hyphomicrobium sp.]